MRKVTATAIKTKAQLESGTLQDLLRTMGNKRVSVTHKGKSYGIVDLVKEAGQVILMAESGTQGMKANILNKALMNTLGQDIFVEIEGKLLPAQKFTDGTVQAKKTPEAESHDAICDEDIVIGKGPVSHSVLMNAMAKIAAIVAGPQPASLAPVQSAYKLNKKGDLVMIETDAVYADFPVSILSSPEAVQDGEVEVNYGEGFEWIQIDELESFFEETFGHTLNLRDPSIKKLLKMYGL